MLLAALLASAVTTGHSSQRPASAAFTHTEPASVLVILTDDMRYDDLEYMPHVQSLLVDKGTTFTRFYSTFPLCCPARASILTGQYAHNHGVLSNYPPYGGFEAFRDQSTLATWLTPTHTVGLVGKYLNQYGTGNDPLYVPPGWDFWRGSPADTYTYRNIGLNIGGYTVESFEGVNSTKVIADQSVDFLSQYGQQPVFLLSSFIAPHVGRPREPTTRWTRRHRSSGPSTATPTRAQRCQTTHRSTRATSATSARRCRATRCSPRSRSRR